MSMILSPNKQLADLLCGSQWDVNMGHRSFESQQSGDIGDNSFLPYLRSCGSGMLYTLYKEQQGLENDSIHDW